MSLACTRCMETDGDTEACFTKE